MASTNHQFLCLALLILGVWASSAASSRTIGDIPMPVRHEQWMAKYGRVYKDAAEKELRFKIFRDNVEYIESVNRAGDRKYKLGINHFTDLTNEEFKASSNGFKPRPLSEAKATTSFRYENLSDVPSTMDWRTQGAVTPVKNQGQCGCCWAFSAVAATEGIIQLTTSNLISLSEQQLVDCAVTSATRGCHGGYMDDAFKFIISNGGLTTEDNYQYMAAEGTCKSAVTPAATISGYEDVPTNSESSLLQAVAKQPVSVAIDGSGYDFQYYSSGIFTGSCGTSLTHAVTAIGYGTDPYGTEYWLVKNSWGTSWGESGYARMERNVGAPEGLCGIARLASYPTA